MAVAKKRTGERRRPRIDASSDDDVEPDDGPDVAERKSKTARRAATTARNERRSRDAADDDDDDDEAPRERRRPKHKRSKGSSGGSGRRWWFGRLAYWAVVLALWVMIGGVGTIVWIGASLPPIQSLEIPKRPPSIQIVGLNGRTLATRGDMGGAVIPLKELPPYLPKAFIAIEDRRFYTHGGVDPIGLGRAAVANLLRLGVSQGGSTITQQLAKNMFLTQERTMTRKLQEVMLAFWLERKFSKAQILELYLNRVYFGAGAYGIEAAAQRYFGKPARQVTLAESALLAGLVKSPSRLAPTRNFNAAERRAQIVLAAMADTHLISDDMAKIAISQAPRIIKQGSGGAVNYAADWVMDVLNDLIGRVEQDIVIETSIDPLLQAAAEKALVEELAQKGEKFDVEQGALVAMTPDGAVRALVGGKNYGESQFNRAVAAKRQPGSAFKPFVYLTAIERGLTPDTIRQDKPIAIRGWKPENYTREYFGPVTLQQALAASLNTVAVRLTLEVGAPAVARTAHRLGITSKLEPNASIALGTSEVSVLELVSAFAVFANGGSVIVPHVVERVRTADGKTLYANQLTSLGRVVDPAAIAMMNTMMRETLLTGTARKAEMPGWPAAGKTGTSQDFRDAWFVGYTGHLVTGVWFGNDDSSPTKKATGSGLPVEVWNRFMKVAHQGVPLVDIPGLAGGVPGFSPNLSPGISPPSAPPPATVALRPAPPGDPARREAANGLDGWLLDRLFGRR